MQKIIIHLGAQRNFGRLLFPPPLINFLATVLEAARRARSPMSDYTTLIRQPAELTDRERQAMPQIYLAHYDGSGKTLFIADLLLDRQ